MREFEEFNKDILYKKPMEINKYTNMELLKYAVGANLYMNGLKLNYNKIMEGDFKGIGSLTICFENSTKESELKICEENTLVLLEKLNETKLAGKLNENNIPLIFIRVRNVEQFMNFTEKLDKNKISFLTGFTFPKFDTSNARTYLDYLKELNFRFDEKLYAMPIFESEAIIYKETRISELLELKKILSDYKDIVLNIRVGGTDFSSKFGIRRSVNTIIYDVKVVCECLTDIVNIFSRYEDGYVVSAAVWEYFSDDVNSKEVQALIKEVNLDKENGFVGKTVIHPTQGKYVNANYAVRFEDYIDSKNIIENSEDGGVFKGESGNNMNEVLPHLNWAKKNIIKSKVFGVLNKGITCENLY